MITPHSTHYLRRKKKMSKIGKYPIKTLNVIQNLETGLYAVSLNTETGSIAKGRLSFDQVIAHLEKYFVFKDDSEFTENPLISVAAYLKQRRGN